MPLRRQIAALPSSQVLSLLLAVALSAAILSCAVLFHQHDLQKQEAYSRQYGQALANLAARQAVDATLNHDLVSLQVLLADVANNGNVIGATIHNVENRLLVQGGHSPSQSPVAGKLRRSYTAVISVQDSIAGYVTVTLSLEGQQRARQELLWQFLWSGIALTIALSLTAIAGDRWKNRNTASAEEEEDELYNDVVPIVEPSQAADQIRSIPIKSIVPARQYSVSLNLKIHNLEILGSQLNKSSFNDILEKFEQQLNKVVKLYSAERLPSKADEVELIYKGESLTEAAFSALCSAQLLLTLNIQQAGPTLKLGAQVSPFTEVANLVADYEQQHCREAIPLQVLIHPTLLDEELQARIEVAEDERTVDARLVQIATPYSELINKQVLQLSSI